MLGKCAGHRLSERLLLLHDQACPDTNLERPLELLGQVIPAVVVTGRVGSEVVLDRVGTPCAVGTHVVGVPGGVEHPTADVAAPISLGSNRGTLFAGESATGATGRQTLTPLRAERLEGLNQDCFLSGSGRQSSTGDRGHGGDYARDWKHPPQVAFYRAMASVFRRPSRMR